MSASRALQRSFLRARPTVLSPVAATRTLIRPRPFHATTAAQAIHELKSKADFDATVREHKTVIIDAFAEWCGPCHMIAPVFEKLSETYPSVRFCKFDVDQLHDVGAELEIRAMPTFSIFQDGQRIEQVVGANPRALQQWLERLTKAE